MTDVKTQPNRRPPARRAEKSRKRRRRSRFSRALILFLLAAGGVLATVLALFRVQQVRVLGSVPYTQQQIASAMGLTTGQNLFTVDRQASAKALCRKLPYIRSATVRLRPFSTVLVTVEKDTPCAAVKNGGDTLLVDSSLKLLEAGGNAAGLPVLSGVTVKSTVPGESIAPGDKTASASAGGVFDALSQNGVALSKVGAISVADPYNLSLRYDSRIDIELGTASDLPYKVKSAVYIITKQLSAASKGRLDVSRATSDDTGEHKIYFDPY